MNHSQFSIGLEFHCGEHLYRCTDIGSRVIVAIRIDEVELSTSSTGSDETRISTLSRDEAEVRGLFNGPPYGVVESVFDEYDLPICEPAIGA